VTYKPDDPKQPSPSIPAVCAFVCVAAVANVFALYFVSAERFVYFWDWAGYWMKYLDLSAILLQHPVHAVRGILYSVRNDDYNYLPVLPLVPFAWVFGPGRLVYILAITNAYLLPAALALGFLAQQISQRRHARENVPLLVVSSAAILTLPALWAPVLRGFPDVVGVLVIVGILRLLFARPVVEQSLRNLVAMGLLLCLLVLLRRWYAYWVAAFWPAVAMTQVLEISQQHGASWRPWMTAVRKTIVIGLTFSFALLVIATPFALRALRTDYADIYSAYRYSSSLAEAAGRILGYFGWSVVAGAATGLVFLGCRRETRIAGTFLSIQALTIFFLFARTQDFGVQHYYLLLPAVAVGVATVVIRVLERVTKPFWRAVSVGVVLALGGVNVAIAFVPRAAGLSDVAGRLATQARWYPLVRGDMDELWLLLDQLEQLEREKEGDVYVLASSEVLNSSIVESACRFGPRRWSFCGHILRTNDVDKRDGFPRQFLDAEYLVLASPAQYHLHPEDQKVIGIVVREILAGHGIGASFRRLAGEFRLESSVTVSLYSKVRPLDDRDVRALTDEFVKYYPDKRDLFIMRNE